MKLRNEGPIHSPPAMDGYAGALARTVQGWPAVDGFTHWRLGSPGTVDGAEFHLGDGELGHVHLDATAHVLLSRKLTAALNDKGLGRSPNWGAEWVTQPVRSAAEVQHATWLFQLAYDRATGTPEDDLLGRITAKSIPWSWSEERRSDWRTVERVRDLGCCEQALCFSDP